MPFLMKNKYLAIKDHVVILHLIGIHEFSFNMDCITLSLQK